MKEEASGNIFASIKWIKTELINLSGTLENNKLIPEHLKMILIIFKIIFQSVSGLEMQKENKCASLDISFYDAFHCVFISIFYIAWFLKQSFSTIKVFNYSFIDFGQDKWNDKLKNTSL